MDSSMHQPPPAVAKAPTDAASQLPNANAAALSRRLSLAQTFGAKRGSIAPNIAIGGGGGGAAILKSAPFKDEVPHDVFAEPMIATRKPGRTGALDMIRQLQTPVTPNQQPNIMDHRGSIAASQLSVATSHEDDHPHPIIPPATPLTRKQSLITPTTAHGPAGNRRLSTDHLGGLSLRLLGNTPTTPTATSPTHRSSLSTQPTLPEIGTINRHPPPTIPVVHLPPEPTDIITSPKVNLTVDSPVKEFRQFHQNIPHPATVLNLVAQEDDREVYTEFDELCNEILSTLGDFEAALEEMTLWKDDFLTQTVPANVKLQLTLLFARLFRSKSEIHEPLFELLKQVRLYSRPWMNKQYALLELEKDYQRQGNVLDVAIKKLEQLQSQMSRMKSERRVVLWERLARKMLDELVNEPQRPESADIFDEDDLVVGRGQSARSKKSSRGASAHSHSRALSGGSRNGDGEQHLGRSRQATAEEGIKAYIAQDQPSWMAKAKTLVDKFVSILKRHHPKALPKLSHLHKRPFRPPLNVKYLSSETKTLHLRTLAPPNMPQRWSLVDISKLDAEYRRQQQFSSMKSAIRNVEPRLQAGKYARLRCNSYNALHDFRHCALVEPFGRKKTQGGASKDSFSVESLFERSKGNLGVDKPVARVNTGEEADSETDSIAEEDSDFEYFTNMDPIAMNETVGKMLDMRKADVDTTGEEEAAMLNSKKGYFSLQDVMELTLLHAQQMQILQAEYEDRIQDLESHANELRKQHADAQAEHEAALKQANDRAQRLAKEYMRNVEEQQALANAAEGEDGDSSSDDDSRGEDDDGEKLKGEAVQTPSGKVDSKGVSPKKKKKAGKRGKLDRKKYGKNKPPATRIAVRRQEHLLKKPVFTSEPFGMSFMERLRWFTEEKLKNKQALQDRFTAIEIAANEERLRQLRLIRNPRGLTADGAEVLDDDDHDHDEQGGGVDTETLRAIFVPHPGQVPPPKTRDTWAEKGINLPWGGRFQASTPKEGSREGMNILNLFDVALRQNALLAKQSQSQKGTPATGGGEGRTTTDVELEKKSVKL
ncbi:hypothetical protein HDV05_005105 [Chytridiales sp. JEL 0842]|nr:hypothetical protein HDV05_005105 [Chytridiales sp. JEL 0842]